MNETANDASRQGEAVTRHHDRAQTLVIRADATTEMGTGHVMRCLALAQEWRDRFGPVHFVTSIDRPALQQRLTREAMPYSQPSGQPGSNEDALATAGMARQLDARWLVVDGYHFSPTYRSSLRGAGLHVLLLDDNGNLGPYDADIVLNQNAHANLQMYRDMDPSTTLLLGTAFTLLRKEFLITAFSPRDQPPRARRLLIAMGGADAANNTQRALEAVSLMPGEKPLCEVIVGAANPHRESLLESAPQLGLPAQIAIDPADLAARMARCDMAISAGGTTLWELCYLGVPTIGISLADNQRNAVHHLHRLGALVDGTAAWTESAAEFSRQVDQLSTDREVRASLAKTARSLVDGRGAQRVVTVLERAGKDGHDRAT